MNSLDEKSYLILINPAAGNWRGVKVIDTIKKYLAKKRINHHIEVSQSPGHISDLVKKLSKNFTHLVSVGGDGTLNELINGIDITSLNTIGLLPIGTGNDFARNLNLHNDINHNLDLIFNSNKHSSFDIGQSIIYENGSSIKKSHRFINSLGIGFDALVAKINQKSKHLSGLISYLYAVILALIKRKDINVEIELDNITKLIGKKLLIAIGNGFTTGGGFYLTPDAKINDNKLDICIIDSVSTLKILSSLPKALFNKLNEVKEASLLKFTNAKIVIQEPALIHTDGEIISENAEKIEISILKNELKIISN